MRDDLDVVEAEEAGDVHPDAGPGEAPRILLVETGAAGPEAFLAASGTGRAMAAAREVGAAVWLVVAVGRPLPGPMFHSLVARVGGSTGGGGSPPRSVPGGAPPE